MVLLSIGRSRRPFLSPMVGLPSFYELAPCCTFGRSRQRARPVSLELGQPFHHQRGPRQRGAARARPTRQQPRRTAPADGQLRVYRRLRPHRPCRLAADRTPTRTRTTARERESCVFESSLTRPRRVFASVLSRCIFIHKQPRQASPSQRLRRQ